jgi:hypothetical protein
MTLENPADLVKIILGVHQQRMTKVFSVFRLRFQPAFTVIDAIGKHLAEHRLHHRQHFAFGDFAIGITGDRITRDRNSDAGDSIQRIELILDIQTVAVSEVPVDPVKRAKSISFIAGIAEMPEHGRRTPGRPLIVAAI